MSWQERLPMWHRQIPWRLFLTLACLSVGPVVAPAASFNCTRAATVTERTICTHPELSTLDDQLMSIYTTVLAQAPHPDTVKARQRAWLTLERNRCQTVPCLQEQYTQRIAALQAMSTQPPVQKAISGTYERVSRGKPDPHTATLTIREHADGRVHVSGHAVWIGNVKTGEVNVGEVEGLFALSGNTVQYTDAARKDGCAFTITVAPNALRVTDDNLQCGGVNVTFNGQYRKVQASQRR